MGRTTVKRFVKYGDTSSARDAISAISSAVSFVLDVLRIRLFFLSSRLPGSNQVVVVAFGIPAYFEITEQRRPRDHPMALLLG